MVKKQKTFDDAICCQKTQQGWTIQVAIADVSYYVTPGNLLDQIASQRGNSVYFPGHVIPMLPPILSDKACSLQPQEDKLVLVCCIHLDKQANIFDYEFTPAVIRSHARLTYNQVQSFLQGNALPIVDEDKKISLMLREAHKIYQALAKLRQARGALEFETIETLLLFNKEGQIRAIVPKPSDEAHSLIEEFMICANRCAARFLAKHGKDFLYRMHQGFKKDAFAQLSAFVAAQGFQLHGPGSCLCTKDASGNQTTSTGTFYSNKGIAESVACSVYTGEQRTFWFGTETLHTLYFSNSSLF